MLENKKIILKTVYELAKNRRIEYERSNKNKDTICSVGFEGIEGLRLNESYKKMDDYLNSLDFEDIKMIQIIMYLGRDMDYDKSDSPDAIYKKYRDDMDIQGWNYKEVEVGQIVQKIPLDKYLENGFKILNIKI